MEMQAGSRHALESHGRHPSLVEACGVWLRVGALGFGGPAGQIALMHREVVELRGWVDDRRFLGALNFCMLLPGPEAQQLAAYLGWMLHGARGALVAGILFVAPGALLMLALSMAYVSFGHTPAGVAVLAGLAPAVVAIVFDAVVRLARRSLRGRATRLAAMSSFIAVSTFGVPFPVVVAVALLVGVLAARAASAPAASPEVAGPAPSPTTSLSVLGAGLLLWGLPLLAVAWLAGVGTVYGDVAKVLSQAAVVTFGGAYAVLAWIGTLATGPLGWVSPAQMVDGLALAETTPGPLVLVLQFVAFVAAFQNPGPLLPVWGGVVASAVAIWATFVPSTLWILVGAPWVDRLLAERRWASGLQVVSAAVVGVVANLGVWFAAHTLFEQTASVQWGVVRATVPRASSVDVFSTVLAALALVALVRFKQPVLRVLAVGVVCSVVRMLVDPTG